MSSVDDLGFPGEDFALDFCDGLRRVPADRAPRASLSGWTDLGASDRINRIHRADVSAVELGWIQEEEVELFEFLLLDVQDGIRKRVQLASVVPVPVSEHDPGYVAGI